MGKRWSTAEAALACRAYCSATNDSINGADQKIEDFNKKLLEVFQTISPGDVESGTHYLRSEVVLVLVLLKISTFYMIERTF